MLYGESFALPCSFGGNYMATYINFCRILGLRLSAEDQKRIEAKAKASKQTVSQRVRGTLSAAMEA